MRKSIKTLIPALISAAFITNAAIAEDGFDPNGNCYATIDTTAGISSIMLGAWVQGYIAAKENTSELVEIPSLKATIGDLAHVCQDDLEISVLGAINQILFPAASGPGSEGHVRTFLMGFYDASVDNHALTQSMVPTAAEIGMVYQEPLASMLVKYIHEAFTSNVTFNPKPDHDALLVTWAMTSDLINGGAILREFPGGYSKVTQYMNPGFPTAKFKFVTTGETLGLAFNGMFFVNDHWIIIPKPWRVLSDN